MALAVARKSIFRDSTEEQVSTMSLANFSGILVVVGDCIRSSVLVKKRSRLYVTDTDQAVEEEVVVVGHGSIVEDRGHLRALGVLDQQFSRLSVRIDGVCTTVVSIYSSIHSHWIDIFARDQSRPGKSDLTLRQQVELIHKESLILGPGEVESLGRHELGNTILLVISIMLQLWDTVQGTGLEAQGGGRCLDRKHNAISFCGAKQPPDCN
jgi:hypothetical protein